ncbi:putative helicase MOV-10 isoform X2 [Monomorium pharaonis]|uniref:putative helicase MOV-10 isoform X2 n=1 Tax=Monomorium pharaonis TaxID=307658 RepID=UPI00174725A6|nr:putative helicase MOV-10 isoform X2 [Monomorium pharaonis]
MNEVYRIRSLFVLVIFNSIFIMQRKNENQDFMICTAPALASRLKLPVVIIPFNLEFALKKINGLELYSKTPNKSGFNLNLFNNYKICIESLSDVNKITEQNYLVILKICLYLIQFEINCEMKKCTLLKYSIKKFDLIEDCFIIDMSSLNNDYSIIIPNDNVILCEINTKVIIKARVVKVQENYIIIKPYYSRDVKILNSEENQYNIRFWSQHWPLRCCHYALNIISKCNWTEIVFPQLKTHCTDMELDIKWINPNIKENEQQKQAVKKILNKTAQPAPYIIFGPPGTGKTATVVEAICQIVRQFPTKNILMCTVSNAAADEITKRLTKNVPMNLIHRMYAPSREWGTVDKKIQPCANFVEETTIFLSKELLLRKKIIITTLISATRLIEVELRENHFSYIFIDEASQATEPDMLIPLAIMKRIEDERIESQVQIVMAGDPYQLGPVIRCRRVKHLLGKFFFKTLNMLFIYYNFIVITFITCTETSMLERLMNVCGLYKKQDEKYNPNYITKLVKNYRSHENLLHISNQLFYDNELEICGGADTQMALNWSYLPNKNFPMIFQEVRDIEIRATTRSVSNRGEVQAVMAYLDILMKSKFGKRTITSQDIGIITPFKQQQLDISHHLATKNLKDITVGTVETFQGQERNVIILSTVRSESFVHNGEEHIGLLSNPKRFNVALTRAKALIIIMGNPDVLCKDKYWKILLTYCKKHNGYISFEEMLNKDVIIKLNSNSKLYS